jgi:hypothetical protein
MGTEAAAKAIVRGGTVTAQEGDFWQVLVEDDSPVSKASAPGAVVCDETVSKCWSLEEQIAHTLACEVSKAITNLYNHPELLSRPGEYATDSDMLALRIATNGGRLLRIEKRQQANDIYVYRDPDSSVAHQVELWSRQAAMPASTNLIQRH